LKRDILDEIRQAKEATHIFILTHNIDFFFTQSLLLPVLHKCGNPGLTIFADSNCASASFQDQSRWLDSIGTRYRVVPVHMDSPWRFHPKAVFISSPDRGLLFIGSGNLSYGGWRENAEVWLQYGSDDDNNPIYDFHNYLHHLCRAVPNNDSIKREIDKAFDKIRHPWVKELKPSSLFLGQPHDGESMSARMLRQIQQPVDRLIICAPYFDIKGDMIRRLAAGSGAAEVVVLVQENQTNLVQEAVVDPPSHIELNTIQGDGDKTTFSHAKFYAFESAAVVTVFAGSANCSIAALGMTGNRGNAEILCSNQLSKNDFEEIFTNELTLSGQPPNLQSVRELEDSDRDDFAIKIVSCQRKLQLIEIAFVTNQEVKITECVIDGKMTGFQMNAPGHLSVKTLGKPARVRLTGEVNGIQVTSPEHWIDDEFQLSIDAKHRSLADSIMDQQAAGNPFSPDNMQGFLDILLKQLDKRATYISIFREKEGARLEAANEPVKFTESDVFGDDYAGKFQKGSVGGNRKSSSGDMFSLLLSFLGNEPGRNPAKEGMEEEQEEIDFNSKHRKHESKEKQNIPSESDALKANQSRASRAFSRAARRMSSEDYLNSRPLEHIFLDLKIIPVFLLKSLNEGWITGQEYVQWTHQIWAKLFFEIYQDDETGQEGDIGWLAKLYRPAMNAMDNMDFVDHQLSASLVAWLLSLPASVESSEMAFLELACMKSIAYYPRLWCIHEPEKVQEELEEIYSNPDLKFGGNWDSTRIYNRWLQEIRRAVALIKFEQVIEQYSLVDVITKIPAKKEVRLGELLWQGKFGLCVVENIDDKKDSKIAVRILHTHEVKKIGMGSISPLRDILTSSLISSNELSSDIRQVLLALTQELNVGLAKVIK
jgi:hypothetical protein